MIRATITAVLVLVLVFTGVLPATGYGQIADGTTTREDLVSPSEVEPDEDLANGTGGKVIRGREDNEEQQFLGKTTFRIDDHSPGASSNSFNIYAEGFSENIRMHWNVVQQEAFDFSSCTSTSATAFGIDRGNDDSGTTTDESLLDAYQSVTYTENNIFVEFYKEEQLAGGPKNITVDDQIVSRVTNCLQNPSEPGWYRMTGYINGSTMRDTQTDYTIYGAARFVYICEGCDSREAAVEKLGPPPTTCPTRDEFDQDTHEWTCRTEDGVYYTNSHPPGSGDEGASQATPTPTPATTATQTAEPTVTRTGTPEPVTQTADEPRTKSTVTGTAATQPDATTATKTAANRRTQTATAASAPARTTRSPIATPTTPTLAKGPGFGALLSVVGLLAAAVLALRRD